MLVEYHARARVALTNEEVPLSSKLKIIVGGHKIRQNNMGNTAKYDYKGSQYREWPPNHSRS